MARRPAIPLYAYQKRWHADEARYKIALKSRQIGFTLFCLTLGAVLDCLKNPGAKWYYLSAGERQAKEAMEDVQKHCLAFKAAIESVDDTFYWEDREWKQLEVRFPNGSRIVGLPANPATARGSRGNVILDEYAFHQDARGIWKAVFPISTHGFKVWVASTPNGKQGQFYELWEHGKLFSKHKVNILDAVNDGLKVNIEELREGIGNEDDWLQEFLCEFLDSALAWIAFDLLDAADDHGASMELSPVWYPEGQVYLGVDFGRKRDLTVLWLTEVIGDVRWTRLVKVMEKAPFDDQLAAINSLMPLVRRACVDATGMGLPLTEQLQKKWGTRVEGVTFTGGVKEDLATHLRQSFEDRRLRIPYDLDIRRDIHSVKRIVTSAGNLRFDADRSDAGHADRFWALALAEHARSAGDAIIIPKVDVVEKSVARGFGRGMGLGAFATPDEDDEDELRGGFSAGAIL